MTSPRSNPRRRPSLYNAHPTTTSYQPSHKDNASQRSPSIDHNCALRKSSTFNSPTTPPSYEHDPIFNIPSLPKRSPTCPKELETLAAGEKRIAQIIGAVDRSLSGLGSFSSDSEATLSAEDWPVPRFVPRYMRIDDADDQDYMDIEKVSDTSSPAHECRQRRKHHASDSGIGSSTTSSSDQSISEDHAGMKQTLVHNDIDTVDPTVPASLHGGRVQSGINGLTMSDAGFVTGNQHALSEYACRQVQKHIILPIVRENKLKDFHSLVSGIPYRVARKEITCLRDLEKVLLWLAPKWSVSKASFLNFCETSIQCIHTTVSHLNEHDQRRPTDRPYTNGYFLDLVEQVRQYAAMLAAERARVASGNPSEEATHCADERLALRGGLSQTGHPAEIVRIKGGRSVSLRTGMIVQEGSPSQVLKRSMSEDQDDDMLRSMARRRKSALPVVKDFQKCGDCEKTFKRPCDLTKHEKTHSRPWKCSEDACKYHEYGWPTEKERDRHENDKHSATPSMYKCHFYPCPYESKRESNCKQHMEKAHNWVYVRSKNNGKTGKAGKKPQSHVTPPTPSIDTPGSGIFHASTPDFSGSTSSHNNYPSHSRNQSIESSAVASEASAPFINEPSMAFDGTFGPLGSNFAWTDSSTEFTSGGLSEYTNNSHRLSWDSAMVNPPHMPSSFEASFAPYDDQPLVGETFDWSNMSNNPTNDFTSYNIQLFTPATSVENRPSDAFSRHPSISYDQPPTGQIHSLSPGAQGDAMLYSPYSNNADDVIIDEGYGGLTTETHRPSHDFALYDSTTSAAVVDSNTDGSMFPELPGYGASAWSGPGTDLTHHLGMNDLMVEDE